jgi:hypothetical protein
MQGRTYYLTTLQEWRKESVRFTASHYVHADLNSASTPDSRVLVMVEADEGTHNALSQSPFWQELPHPLSSKLIPETVAQALSTHGVTPFNSTFEATETVANNHPILRYRVF